MAVAGDVFVVRLPEAEMRKVEEKEEAQARKRLRAQKPKYMMREPRFWGLIDALDWRHDANAIGMLRIPIADHTENLRLPRSTLSGTTFTASNLE